jgi:uncharacterized protein (UPF0276 family)
MVSGVGLGFRRDIAKKLIELEDDKLKFIEFAPENWMKMGGYWKKKLDAAADKYPVMCHGLSLSIGSPDDLDFDFLKDLKEFFDIYNPEVYSEHLSYSKCDNAHLYDLLPIPFREDAIEHVSERIKTVQDFLERPIAIENVSYYTPVAAEMDEATFISEIVKRSGCNLLLDVNNVYVNAFNHNYDAKEFINSLPLDRVKYIHMAGHEQVSPDTIIDTHGSPIIDPVFDLFEWTINKINPVPILLERDFNIPKLSELQEEVGKLQAIVDKVWEGENATES